MGYTTIRERERGKEEIELEMSAIFNFFFIIIVFQHFLIRNIEAELYVWYECWTKKLSLSFRNEYSWFVRQRYLSMSLILSSLSHTHSLFLFDASFSDNQEQRKSDYTAQYMQMWKENYVSNIIPSICVKFTLSCEKSFFLFCSRCHLISVRLHPLFA